LALLDFTSKLVAFRKEHPVFRRRRFLYGHSTESTEWSAAEIWWLRPDSTLMQTEDWQNGFAKSLMVYLNGAAIREPDNRGNPIEDDDVLMCLNASENQVVFTVPEAAPHGEWKDALDTGPHGTPESAYAPGESFPVEGRSIRVLILDRYNADAFHLDHEVDPAVQPDVAKSFVADPIDRSPSQSAAPKHHETPQQPAPDTEVTP
jgi:glycogen operon protein